MWDVRSPWAALQGPPTPESGVCARQFKCLGSWSRLLAHPKRDKKDNNVDRYVFTILSVALGLMLTACP